MTSHFSVFTTSMPWLKTLEPTSPFRGNLIAFHHAGGNYLAYRNWYYLRENGVRLCLVSLPGRLEQISTPCVVEHKYAVEQIFEQITSLLDEPYIMFGHSMGAVLAYEVAHSIVEHGRPLPLHLFVSGSCSPSLDRLDDDLVSISDEEFVKKVVSFGGMSKAIVENQELLDIILPALRADFRLIDDYSYRQRPALPIPLSLLCGDNDPRVPVTHTDKWEEETSLKFSKYLFSGGHFYLQDAAHERRIQEIIYSALISELVTG